MATVIGDPARPVLRAQGGHVVSLRPIAAPRLPQAWSPSGGAIATIFDVRRAGPGWRLTSQHLEPLYFPTGRSAERQGRRLARSLARAGHDAQVNVYDVRGQLAGTIRYFGCDVRPEPEVSRAYPWAH